MAKSLKTFWLACEKLATAGVMKEWESEVRDTEVMDAARQMLAPLPELATEYPCTNSLRCTCFHKAVIRRDSSRVAVCTCDGEDDYGCEPISVTENDLVRYQLDFPKVFRGLCKAAGFDFAFDGSLDFRKPIPFGRLVAGPASIPVHFVLASYNGLSVESLMELLIGSYEPLILFTITPFDYHINSRNQWHAESRLVISLLDLFSVTEDGTIGISRELRALVDDYTRRAAAYYRGEQVRKAESSGTFTHSNGYRTITLRGKQLPHLSPLQADVVRILHEAAMSGEPELSYAEIACRLSELHADDFGFEAPEKMSKIFRSGDHRSDLVVSPRRGYHRLEI